MLPDRSPKQQRPANITAQSYSQSQRNPSDCPPQSPRSPRSPQSRRHHLWSGNTQNTQQQTAKETVFSPTESLGQLSPGATDRVFPIRSVVSVDPNPTPGARSDRSEGYFQTLAQTSERRRSSATSASEVSHNISIKFRQGSGAAPDTRPDNKEYRGRKSSDGTEPTKKNSTSLPQQTLNDVISGRSESDGASETSDKPPSVEGGSSVKSSTDELGGLLTARFKHVITEGGHAVITGRDGDTLQRCEDEPIHIPGAIQEYGLLIALQEEADGKLVVRVVSENSERMIGYAPRQLFALDSFCDILSEAQADNLLDHVDFIRDEDADVGINGPEVFTISIRSPKRRSQKLWCAMHMNERNPGLIICEFELEDDPTNPLIPSSELTPELPEDTLHSNPTPEEFAESTENSSRPLRVLRSARKRKGEAAAMEVFNIMSQVQEQLAVAPNLQKFLKVLVGVVKELTGFHRVMIYQFDKSWNGRVVTELVDPRATKDLYKGLNFPASDIPKQARDLYKVNKVRLLYDRDQETARLVCRTLEDLKTPLDLTYSYLRAMSPIHLKYLANMAVRSSMSISINAFNELWGLIACHSYGPRGMRVSFPIRKMCRLVGDSASRNIERLSYASRLQARKLINTVPSQHNPSGYIVASSEDLLKLFDADFGLLSIRDETKILGHLDQSQEALAMLEYLRMRKITSVTMSQDITQDFPDLRYPPGFSVIAGLLLVPLSAGGNDFIVLFRKGQLKEVKWAGNPYEKFIKEGTEGYLEPRKSFKTWSEVVVGKCREWTEEEIETAAVLCLVYGKFIEVWRQKEAALQSSQLTRLLLANSAHEVRTPLNAIINYLEIALEGTLDQETRENLAKSHSASKSLIYVINDLLDLTKTEEGGELVRGEVFDIKATLREATDMFTGDAKRKGISYEVVEHPGVPQNVVGDQRKVRQAISNVTANAIQNTTKGGVKVEMYVVSWYEDHADVEIAVEDSGIGMSSRKLDALFRDLEQVQSETTAILEDNLALNAKTLTQGQEEKRTLGLGLAVVARIVRNMDGQLRLKSEEGKGSRFILQFPFDLPDDETKNKLMDGSTQGSTTPQLSNQEQGEVTLVDRDKNRRGSRSSLRSPRQGSVDSINSKRSLGSLKSVNSAMSNRSDVDRLIEAIREPHLVEPRSPGERSMSARSTRPRIDKRASSSTSNPSTPQRSRARSLDSKGGSLVTPVTPKHLRSMEPSTPGQVCQQDSGTAIKAVKVPDDLSSPPNQHRPSGKIVGEVGDKKGSQPKQQRSADHMNVLVAEDDPVNSKIMKKRLEKLGHEAHLTVNGEDCASAYGDKAGFYDVVLMDMQMPIVDGLTSTKMIRSFEKTHPSHMLSKRASLNGRIPIIAVSASLVEKDRQSYIDAGFDGWILKPISFARLSELMVGIVDQSAREAALYKPGDWEKGGWFNKTEPDIFAADTSPSGRVPSSNPSKSVKIAAAMDDPAAGDGGNGDVPEEQRRLLEEQERYRQQHMAETDGVDLGGEGKKKTRSAPELSRTLYDGEAEGWDTPPQVASPEPMDE